MKVIFYSVEARNFRSFADFTLDLEQLGVTLVQGKVIGGSGAIESNGAGKSSLFAAISWALFGKFLHVTGQKVVGDKVIRRGSVGGCVVEVRFRRDSDSVSVIRYRGHSEFGNKVRLIVNGDEFTQSSNLKTQEKVEDLLGITFELFVSLIYISESTVRESFVFEPDAQRKKILVNALPQFQEFGRARIRVKDTLSAYKAFIESLDIERKAYERALVQLEDDPLQNENIESISSRIKDLDDESRKASERIEELRKLSQDLLDRSTKLEEDIRGTELCMDVDEATSKLNVEGSRLADIQAEIRFLDEKRKKWTEFGSICPTCEQEVPPSVRQEHLRSLSFRMKELESRAEVLTLRIDKLRGLLHEHTKKMEQLRSMKASVESERDKVASEISAEVALQNEFTARRAGLQDVVLNLQETQLALKKERDSIKLRLNEIAMLRRTSEIFEQSLRTWIDGFGPKGVLSLGLAQNIETFAKKSAGWLEKLWHEGASLYFCFTGGDLSKIDVRLYLNQHEVDLNSLSSGESRRLCLSICFGLRDSLQILTGWSSNLLVLDEVFDGLDNAGRSKVLQEIRTQEDLNVSVISQFPQIGEGVDRIIRVVHDRDVSTLQLEEILDV